MEVEVVGTTGSGCCEYEYEYGGGYEKCMTPKHGASRIPVSGVPPPPPKKKRSAAANTYGGISPDPPKNGYFNPPDLELIFQLARPPTQKACA